MTWRYWGDLTGPELDAVANDASVAVVPIAAVEQHGPHLPLSTDVTIGEGLLAGALECLRDASAPVFVLPTLAIGASLEHTGFAGTLSIAPETAITMIVSIGASLAAAGVRRLVLFNSHGGNKAVLDLAALKLRAAHGMLVVKANYFRFAPPADSIAARELAHGLHGGALETSLMLYLAPDSVRRAHIAEFKPIGARRAEAGATLLPEGDAGFAWMAEDLNPQGVAGDARLASAEHGAALAAHFSARLAEIIEETQAFDMTALGRGI